MIKILLGSLALTFVATAATAQVGPPTSQRPCAANRALVIKDGAVVLDTGPPPTRASSTALQNA